MVAVRRERGFTLIEMLVVMTLLVAFGYLTFSLMRGSLELWRKGEAGRDLGEKAAAVFDLFLRDLRALHVGREGRMVSEMASEGVGGEAQPSRRLRIVRTVDRGEELRVFRQLGLVEASSGEPLAEVPSSGGLIELAYADSRDRRGSDPAIRVLYRGVRPVGEASGQSFFAEDFFRPPGPYGEALREVTGGVLFFDVVFQRWRGERAESWDSAQGTPGDPRDDVFPRAAQLTLVLERDGAESRLTFLSAAVDAEDLRLEVDDPKRLPREFPSYVKVDGEWIELSSIEGKIAAVRSRGARATARTPHAAGARIHVGATFESLIDLGKPREDWNAAR